MRLEFVYKILPAIIIYTDCMPDNFSGCSNAMIVRIRSSRKDDQGLLEHELIHVRQTYQYLILPHAILYLFSKGYRLRSEVESYRKQLEISSQGSIWVEAYLRDLYAGFIAEKYGLNITKEQVLELLQ